MTSDHHKRGNCYVTCEALYHLIGGKEAGWKPMHMKHEGLSHWFLKHVESEVIIDPTVSQFKSIPDYHKAKGKGFLTKNPSIAARAMMDIMVYK